jgi:DNA-binding MarR family transcriptional regulator
MIPNQEFIEKIRGFNRFFTSVIGLLNQHYLNGPFSLTEGRVLYEIHHTENCSAKTIRANIAIDEGYLSRIIDKFIKMGLIEKTPSPQDRRLHIIVPTEKGLAEFTRLNDNSNKLIVQITKKLSREELEELTGMMDRIRQLLDTGQN